MSDYETLNIISEKIDTLNSGLEAIKDALYDIDETLKTIANNLNQKIVIK